MHHNVYSQFGVNRTGSPDRFVHSQARDHWACVYLVVIRARATTFITSQKDPSWTSLLGF